MGNFILGLITGLFIGEFITVIVLAFLTAGKDD